MKKLLFSLFFLALSVGLFAQERILFFDAQAYVNNDGSVSIVENITVNAEHQQIRRGLYRDIPLRFGENIQIEGLRMDHAPHPFFTEKISGGIRVNFGDDRYIERGQHTYSFAYKMFDVIRPFKDYDEVYWNATGNYWAFPIEYARAEVFLPEGAEPFEDKISVYTGKSGSKASHAQREGLKFWITRPLSAHSGMTVAVPFEKGHIQFSSNQKTLIWLQENALLLGWILFGLMCIYCYVLWYLKGRDPVSRGVVRQFEPPQGISAVMAKYIYDMKFDIKILTVFLISMVMKGAMTIRQEGKKHFILCKKEGFEQELSQEEKNAYDSLEFMTEINNAPNGDIIMFQNELAASLNTKGKKYFKTNELWLLPLFLVIVLFLVGLYYLNQNAVFMVLPPVLFVPVCRTLLKTSSLTGKALSLLILILIGLGCFFVLPMLPKELLFWLVLFISFTVLFVLFAVLIRQYSPNGRKIKDALEGFKEYLSIGEAGRVEMSDPTNAQKIFCDYLPYAVALGVENKWIASFEKLLSKSDIQEQLAKCGFNCFVGVNTLLSSVNSSLISSCRTQHSGSDGGGFSGGGFGGGGGGGR